MREFDHNGLLLAEYQGKLFEKSYDTSVSTGIFMRRFLHSELVKTLDMNKSFLISMDVNEGIESIFSKYKASEYGKEKYSKSSLFWIGYMYRYISYTREQSTKFVMKLFTYKQMNDVYYTYHTQDPEWCIQSLLDLHNLTEDIFDNNYRLKKIMEADKNNKKFVFTANQ